MMLKEFREAKKKTQAEIASNLLNRNINML